MKDDIIKLLQETRPEFDFHSSVHYLDDGLLDSLDIITLVASLEATFGVLISGTDILPENFASADAIKLLVDRSARST